MTSISTTEIQQPVLRTYAKRARGELGFRGRGLDRSMRVQDIVEFAKRVLVPLSIDAPVLGRF